VSDEMVLPKVHTGVSHTWPHVMGSRVGL